VREFCAFPSKRAHLTFYIQAGRCAQPARKLLILYFSFSLHISFSFNVIASKRMTAFCHNFNKLNQFRVELKKKGFSSKQVDFDELQRKIETF
jgi:hypothetical protein